MRKPTVHCWPVPKRAAFASSNSTGGGGLKGACKEMGVPAPNALMKLSGKGGDHAVFRQTAESIALGNRSASLPEGGEWFSFRAKNKYMVAGGSTHPNGNLYKVVNNVPPIPCPLWVIEFVK